jgi:hypothetical protein
LSRQSGRQLFILYRLLENYSLLFELGFRE